MKYFLYVFILLAVFVLGGCTDVAKPVKIENTKDKQKEWFENYLAEHIKVVQANDNGTATIISDGKITDSLGNASFSITEESTMSNPPDRHSQSTYKIAEISKKGVLVEYTSKFNHQSFGKNLITIDIGEILLEYRTRK